MTITIAPTVEASNVPPRVRLDVTASAGETQTSVTRVDPDGVVRPVRTSTGTPVTISAGVGLLYDYEVPYQAAVSYSSLESPATVSVQVTVPESRVWLVHPGVPTLSMPIDLYADSFAEETWDVQQGVFWPMGRETPIVQTDGSRKSPASSVTVAIDTTADLHALRALTQDASILLLNVPTSLGYGVDTSYIAVGSIRNRRVVNIGSETRRAVEMPYQVVDQPVGGSQSARTYTDLLTFSTYAEMQAAYPSYLTLLSGP